VDENCIILLTDGLHPFVVGGMQKHSRLFAEYIAKCGIQVIIYHYLEQGDQKSEGQIIEIFSKEARKNIQLRTFEYYDVDRLPGHYLRSQRRISRLYLDRLKTENCKPIMVYTKGFVGGEVIQHRSDLPFNAPIAVKFHGMNMFQKQPNWKGEITKYTLRPTVRRIMNNADVVFSYGGKITDIISAQLSKPEKIIELPSGIEEDWLNEFVNLKTPQIRSFIFVGRKDPLKGLKEMYQAIARIPENLNWKLQIVGPFDPMDQLEHSKIEYIGEVRDAEKLKELYDDNDVLLCPSISEGMPNVIMEAMSRGLAIIATDVGATASLVDSQNGSLIEPGNIDHLTDSMIQMIQLREAELIEMRKRSIQRIAEKFTWEKIGLKFLESIQYSIE
jgi:glycosyltransferase involved in cell wall biosynthesis